MIASYATIKTHKDTKKPLVTNQPHIRQDTVILYCVTVNGDINKKM